MANILKVSLENNGFNQKVEVKSISVELDADITVAEINNYLPNNGTKFNTVDYISLIPSNSKATILTPNTMFVCVFLSETGTKNSETGYLEGTWKCLGKRTYLS
jgi:hypothetical protein